MTSTESASYLQMRSGLRQNFSKTSITSQFNFIYTAYFVMIRESFSDFSLVVMDLIQVGEQVCINLMMYGN